MSSSFVCSNCSYQSLKWLGKCPSCGEWNTLIEKPAEVNTKINSKLTNTFHASQSSSLASFKGINQIVAPVSLEDIYTELAQNAQNQNHSNGILAFNNPYLVDFWNKGILSDSLTLLAGEPGLGKSTFALQILRDLIKESVVKNQSLEALYISAEESLMQLASRAQRLDIPAQIQVLNLNNLENIIEIIANKVLGNPSNQIVIIDSIQTIYSAQATGSPGSVSQVTFIVNQLLNISKSAGIAIILVGHVTKTGDIAGPKTLEHMVDSVLLLDQPQTSSKYRTLSFNKHRFGSTDKLLFLEMAESGLSIIKNPSLILLENIENGVGISYGLALDHEQPLLIEIQALVHNTGNSFGRREATGTNQTKLNIIIALLEKYLNLDLKSYDVYTQILGLPKGLNDDSLDLGIALAILSSLKNLALDQILEKTAPINIPLTRSKEEKGKKSDSRSIYCGRLTLSGSVRNATNQKSRQDSAKKLGFKYNQALENLKEISELRKILN